MNLHDLHPNEGAHKTSKRVGRGHGSGKGKTSGRGMGGQKSRSGPGPYRTFEGGQNRLVKRMPFKRGFTNIWRVEYQVVNVEDLQNWPAGVEVTLETLLAARLIRRKAKPVKLLGEGELSNALTVRVHKASGSARQKIEAAGGTIEELPYVVPRRSRSQGANPRPRKSKVDA